MFRTVFLQFLLFLIYIKSLRNFSRGQGGMTFLPFSLPDISDEEIAEVVDTLRSGWLSTGPKTRQFEKEFAEYIGHGVEAVSVNSATAGLHLALEAVGLKRGDEVIMSPVTFTASAEVVRYFDAHPKFVDIDPETLNLDPRRLEAAIGPRTAAVMPVHFGGLPCDMAAISEIAVRRGLKVVEDAAHSFPASSRGRLIGTLDSDAAVFSFYATKTLATGEGGMIVTKNPEIAKRCRVMRLHGISRDAFDRYVSKDASWYYEVVAPGFKYNLSDLASSLGIHQLRKAGRFLERRRQIASEYNRRFAHLPVKLPPGDSGLDTSAHHLYVLQLRDEARLSRDDFIRQMSEKGIGCSVHFIPLHLHPYWRDTYGLKPTDFPLALNYFQRTVSIPLYTKMTDDQVNRVADTVIELLG
jgi:dTDP-4-amino-4,6-dideoxygalactose transaminase